MIIKRIKYILTCCLRTIPVLLLLAAGPASSAEAVFKHPWLTVVMDDNYPPYSFRDDQGRLQGIRKEMWDAWSAHNGIEVRVVATDWAKALAYMNTGQADVIDTIFETPERESLYTYSRPYADIDVPIFFHQSISGITGAENLHGFTVGVKAGDACEDWLHAHGIYNTHNYPSFGELVDAAARNDIRVMCIDKPLANYFLTKRDAENHFRYSKPLYTGQLHWAVIKGNERAFKAVSHGFEQVPQAEIEAIEKKWMGSPLARPAAEIAPYILYAMATAAVLSFVMLLWNRTLRRRVASRTGELELALHALKSSEQHYQALVSTSPVGVFETDVLGQFVFMNERGLRMLGARIEQLRGNHWQHLLHAEDREESCAAWRESLDLQQPFQRELRFERIGGGTLWVLMQARPMDDSDGLFSGYIGTFTDISEQKASEQRIQFLAYHDPLTGLPNRLLIREHYDMAVAHANRAELGAALLVLDLDHFKNINDSLGHAVGDELLCAVVKILRGCVRDTDTISRQGGDEFLVLLTDQRSADDAANVAAKMLDRLSQPIRLEHHELSISLSIGIGMYPADGEDFDTLLKKADTAMYHAKESGRNAFNFFTSQMNADATQTLMLRSGLARALERQEFVLHYQPQVDLETGRITGTEALLRWQHPELGLVPPNRFIGIAENSGLIVPIGEWVIQEACRQAAVWQETGLPQLTMAVNLSAIQFKRGNLVETVENALLAHRMPASLLELELTESILIQDTDNVLATVDRLKSMGIKLSIDDFGTGYSSLMYLHRLNVDKLKIDQSFVRDLNDDPDDAAIVQAVIQMAKSLKLRTIAEGVENPQQLEALRRQTCDEVQGYYLGRPMLADDFARHVADWKPFT
jgi:diguanylate cyclase (GGDEF)-like protein/PAS domain S-box-containing protein